MEKKKHTLPWHRTGILSVCGQLELGIAGMAAPRYIAIFFARIAILPPYIAALMPSNLTTIIRALSHLTADCVALETGLMRHSCVDHSGARQAKELHKNFLGMPTKF